jgi:hypothetical protein
MSWIRIHIQILPTQNGQKVLPDDARKLVEQIKVDALYGTYGQLDDTYWHSRMEHSPASLSETELRGEPQVVDELLSYEFELKLASALFPPDMGGAGHLFSMLAGDLLRFTLQPYALKDWRIKAIEFPPSWQEAQFNTFRKDIANDIFSIRSAFNLKEGMPLLAFSLKPRVGFTLQGLQEAATQVLCAGFNVVELDTRHLPLDAKALQALIDFACLVPDIFPKHVARLSLNLSMRGDIALQAAAQLCEKCPKPVILKIDGGLNGINSVQSIRGQKLRDGRKHGPIITCYPLLNETVKPYVPDDLYVMSLASSGVDIIYPGGRPDIGSMVRSLHGGGQGNQIGSVERYKNLMQNGWPMLSIAGGIYPGQLQAFYELLGPDVAWFIGGGVALHKDGPTAGAALCVRVAQESAERKYKAGKSWATDLSPRLSEQADSMFKDRSMLTDEQLRYVSPIEHLSKIHGLAPYNA